MGWFSRCYFNEIIMLIRKEKRYLFKFINEFLNLGKIVKRLFYLVVKYIFWSSFFVFYILYKGYIIRFMRSIFIVIIGSYE